MGYKVDFQCKLRWAQNLLEPFMGDEGTPEDKLEKIKASEGWYQTTLVMDDQTKEFLLSKGISDKGLHGHNWKTTPEGDVTWYVRRPHVNPRLTDDDGNPIVYGPPKVMIEGDDGTNRDFDPTKDGLIGNDTLVKVRMDVYTKGSKNINTLEAVKILDLVEYEGSDPVPSLEDF